VEKGDITETYREVMQMGKQLYNELVNQYLSTLRQTG